MVVGVHVCPFCWKQKFQLQKGDGDKEQEIAPALTDKSAHEGLKEKKGEQHHYDKKLTFGMQAQQH